MTHKYAILIGLVFALSAGEAVACQVCISPGLKPCGDSCISQGSVCNKPPGCAEDDYTYFRRIGAPNLYGLYALPEHILGRVVMADFQARQVISFFETNPHARQARDLCQKQFEKIPGWKWGTSLRDELICIRDTAEALK